MIKNTVTVIMSTYNGEKYLEQQLESLIKQKNVELYIWVRDDGSTDKTQEILENWKKKGLLDWYKGDNLKPAYSFLDAVQSCPYQSEYYAFCDQDDYWLENKLSIATQELNKLPKDELNLFMSTYDVVDSKLNKIYTRDMKFNNCTLQGTLMNTCPSGCTMVFNKALLDKIGKSNPKYIRMHDFWTLLTVESFNGNIITLDEPLILYRQHENNVVGETNKLSFSKVQRLVRSAIYGNNERQRQAESLISSYENIPEDNKKEILKLVRYKSSLKSKYSLLFDKKYRTDSFKTNLLFVISVFFRVF